MTIRLTSVAFAPAGVIPRRHTCDGEDVSPPLAWAALPAGTTSLALVMDDPDAPPGVWVHWVLYDLPATAAGLGEGVAKTATLSGGAKQGACWGVDRFDRVGYHGPCPPPGKPHRYYFRLYALDRALGLAPCRSKAELLAAMERRVLGRAELMGTYGR